MLRMTVRLHLLLLLLLLGLCGLPGSLQELTCYECQRINTRGVCETGEDKCECSGDQQCFLRKVYQGGQLLYAHQGCSDLCLSFGFFRPDIEVDLACCKNASFCNKF